MDLSKLTYTKGSSERSLQDTIQKPSTGKEEKGDVLSVPVPAAYRKVEGVFSPNLVFVLSGGEKREKDFLWELIKQQKLRSLRVVFMSKEGQGLQPYQMQERWQEILKAGKFMISGQVYRLDEMDKVFLLSDVDEFYDQLVKVCENTSGGRGQWIISNPCFEIWLYYCYLNDPETDLKELLHLTAAQRSKKLKSLGQTLVPGGLNPCVAFERMTVGIGHSEAHYDIDENKVPVLFATQMHEMAQYMVDVMDKNANEYSEFIKRKENWRKLMREK